nr:hypothetical protein MOLUWOTD_MOLUWOTD_CDS_0002 [Microvirus sp.]
MNFCKFVLFISLSILALCCSAFIMALPIW